MDDDSQAENIATDFGRDWGSEWGEEDITRNLQRESVEAIWFLKREMPDPALSSMGNIQEAFSIGCISFRLSSKSSYNTSCHSCLPGIGDVLVSAPFSTRRVAFVFDFILDFIHFLVCITTLRTRLKPTCASLFSNTPNRLHGVDARRNGSIANHIS